MCRGQKWRPRRGARRKQGAEKMKTRFPDAVLRKVGMESLSRAMPDSGRRRSSLLRNREPAQLRPSTLAGTSIRECLAERWRPAADAITLNLKHWSVGGLAEPSDY